MPNRSDFHEAVNECEAVLSKHAYQSLHGPEKPTLSFNDTVLSIRDSSFVGDMGYTALLLVLSVCVCVCT